MSVTPAFRKSMRLTHQDHALQPITARRRGRHVSTTRGDGDGEGMDDKNDVIAGAEMSSPLAILYTIVDDED